MASCRRPVFFRPGFLILWQTANQPHCFYPISIRLNSEPTKRQLSQTRYSQPHFPELTSAMLVPDLSLGHGLALNNHQPIQRAVVAMVLAKAKAMAMAD